MLLKFLIGVRNNGIVIYSRKCKYLLCRWLCDDSTVTKVSPPFDVSLNDVGDTKIDAVETKRAGKSKDAIFADADSVTVNGGKTKSKVKDEFAFSDDEKFDEDMKLAMQLSREQPTSSSSSDAIQCTNETRSRCGRVIKRISSSEPRVSTDSDVVQCDSAGITVTSSSSHVKLGDKKSEKSKKQKKINDLNRQSVC